MLFGSPFFESLAPSEPDHYEKHLTHHHWGITRRGMPGEEREWCRVMMEWYNEEHHHEGLGFMKPSQVHHGMVEELAAARQQTLEAAMKAHPERFVRGKVSAPRPPEVIFLNPPLQDCTDAKPD